MASAAILGATDWAALVGRRPPNSRQHRGLSLAAKMLDGRALTAAAAEFRHAWRVR